MVKWNGNEAESNVATGSGKIANKALRTSTKDPQIMITLTITRLPQARTSRLESTPRQTSGLFASFIFAATRRANPGGTNSSNNDNGWKTIQPATE